jgi:ral guanine nucleotide dissociation stimulator
MSFIVGTWLKQYSEDFTEPLNFPCLKKLVNYLQVNMPGSDEENHAKLLLAQMEHLAPSKEKSEGEEPGEYIEHARRGLCWPHKQEGPGLPWGQE